MRKELEAVIDVHFRAVLHDLEFVAVPGKLKKSWISEYVAHYEGLEYVVDFELDTIEPQVTVSVRSLNPRLPNSGCLDAVLSYLEGKNEIGRRSPESLVAGLRRYHDAIAGLMSDAGRNDYSRFEAWQTPIVAAMKKQREESERMKKKWWQFW